MTMALEKQRQDDQEGVQGHFSYKANLSYIWVT